MAEDLETPHTFYNLAEESLRCLQESEKAHNAANARRAKIREEAKLDLMERNHRAKRKSPVTKGEVDRLTNSRAGEDSKWKASVGLNRWMLDRSTAYSSAALVLAEWERRATDE